MPTLAAGVDHLSQDDGPLRRGAGASIKAIEEAMSSNTSIFLVAQKDIRVEVPDRNHLFDIGTVSTVRQILRLPGKTIRVMVEGEYRARLHDLVQTEPYLVAQVEPAEHGPAYEGKSNSLRAEAAIRQPMNSLTATVSCLPRVLRRRCS